MADSKNTFLQRVFSALAGAAVVFAVSYYGGVPGIQGVIAVAVILAIREYSRMVFQHWQMPPTVNYMYWLVCAGLFTLLFLHFTHSLFVFAAANVIYLTATLWLARGRASNENVLAGVAMGCFGLLYCVLFPFFAVRIALLADGAQWFLFLLVLVFFGDTFAYFGGRWMGRHKMMPNVSPNKTWEGAAAGLLGSSLAGVLLVSSVFQEVPWFHTLLFCLVCGVAAQSGDLLMSLVKRVAHVKDSGHIMPGHGGILDRLDGIFIACPLVYAFALYARPF